MIAIFWVSFVHSLCLPTFENSIWSEVQHPRWLAMKPRVKRRPLVTSLFLESDWMMMHKANQCVRECEFECECVGVSLPLPCRQTEQAGRQTDRHTKHTTLPLPASLVQLFLCPCASYLNPLPLRRCFFSPLPSANKSTHKQQAANLKHQSNVLSSCFVMSDRFASSIDFQKAL